MSAPTISVGIALINAPEDGDFILDDATRGILDGTSYTLASGFTSVTPDAYSVSIRRGRWSRLWDSFEAGTASVSVWNHDRDYDPAYLLSPYNLKLTPGRALRVMADDWPLFVGQVDDISLGYEVSGQSAATFVATDTLGVLGQMEVNAFTSATTSADAKLSAICDRPEVAWPSTLRVFDPGIESLISQSVGWGTNVKAAADLIARSDLGFLFSATDGTLTFRNRNYTASTASVCSFSDQNDTFSAPLYDDQHNLLLDDDGEVLTGEVDSIGFTRIEATMGSELLFARVGVNRDGGAEQTATVADMTAWVAQYGPARSLSITGLLIDDDAQSLAIAEYLLTLYDEPRYRINEIEVDLTGMSTTQQAAVLALDIMSVVDVTFLPNSVGDAIQQTLVVQGISHNISVDRHTVAFSLIEQPLPFFRLDDAVYGILDGVYVLGII